MPRAMQAPMIPTTSNAFSTCWPGTLTGWPEISPWSFPKAMFEPQNEIEPTTIENRIGTKVSRGIEPPNARSWRNSAHEISATAPPPTPLYSATICGIAVICTRCEAITPTAVPIASPVTMRPQLPMPSSSSVVTTAIAMPTAAIRLPCLAVVGWVPRLTPMMKSEKATM